MKKQRLSHGPENQKGSARYCEVYNLQLTLNFPNRKFKEKGRGRLKVNRWKKLYQENSEQKVGMTIIT